MVKLTKKSNFLTRKTVLLVLLAIIVFVAVGVRYANKPRPSISPTPVATINNLTPQPAANDGEKQLESSNGVNNGNATDNQGRVSSPLDTSPGQWLSSSSGIITVKQPIAGSTIKSGVNLVGSAKVTRVQYRLIDNQVGVIAQGFVNVVSGNFSANLNFQSHGSGGRLDVFTADDNGVESNEVQITVSF